jgi:molybdopterin adenylyltransferase
MGHADHRARAPSCVRCAVITVSDTRSIETDESGAAIERLLEAAGHRTASRTVVADDRTRIGAELRRCLADPGVDAVIVDGGTGIAPRDVTVEVVGAFLDRELPGFGELFRALSFGKIGSSAMLSRACAGIAAGRPVFCLPGSTDAVALGMESLILPELGHLVGELRRGEPGGVPAPGA